MVITTMTSSSHNLLIKNNLKLSDSLVVNVILMHCYLMTGEEDLAINKPFHPKASLQLYMRGMLYLENL